ncbi:MAG: Mov34/MPN/PAD-1 family protein [Ignavibacteria bacterium]|nr:Mov34/MPN/PAD-1 family protein [Ignavibacteria bacterium]
MVEFNSNNADTNFPVSEYPKNSELIGNDDNGLKIFIERNNLFGIEEYLRSDTNNELGGVLIGNVYKDKNDKLFIVIKNNIIAESTNASLSRLTFTHETWEKINANLEKDFPNQKILGWYHSHPGHSVFLSTYDVFIQDNFFDMPYMTAFVYDPIINDRGFFYKDESGIKKSEGYYIYGDRPELIKPTELNIEMSKPLENIEVKKNDNSNKSSMKNIVIIALVVINFIFCLLLFVKMNSYEKELSRFENVNNQLNELKSENIKLNQKYDSLIKSFENDRITALDTTKQKLNFGR